MNAIEIASYKTLVNLTATVSCGMTRKDLLSAYASGKPVTITIPDKGCITGGTRHIISEDGTNEAYGKSTITAIIRGVNDVGEKGETLIIPCVVSDDLSKVPGKIRSSAYDGNDVQEKDSAGKPVAHMLDISLDPGDYFELTVLHKRNYAEIACLTATDGNRVYLAPNPLFEELLTDTDYCIPEEVKSFNDAGTPLPTDG